MTRLMVWMVLTTDVSIAEDHNADAVIGGAARYLHMTMLTCDYDGKDSL